MALSFFLLALPLPLAAQERNASFLPTDSAAKEEAGEGASAAFPAPSPPSLAPAPILPAPVAVAPVAPLADGKDNGKDKGAPVEARNLGAVDPDSVGLLSPAEGGLGSALWEGSSRELVERLLADAALPSASPALNDLVARLLASVTTAPSGVSSAQPGLTALRIEKLLALGRTGSAWDLLQMAKPGHVDAATRRRVTEARLVVTADPALCETIKASVKGEEAAEWQKALLVCQLRANDFKGAQLGLDLLRESGVKDDGFVTLASRNILGGSKTLPRSLTPLKPLNLALLRQIDLPLPPEVYGRPEPALVPELLKAKAMDDNARLQLAERMAARGLMDSDDLGALYAALVFPAEIMKAPLASGESGARLRALLWQALRKPGEPPPNRNDMIAAFFESLDAAALNGTAGEMAAELVAAVPVVSDQNRFAGTALRVLTLAGRYEEAAAWNKLVEGPAGKLPEVIKAQRGLWPFLALAGLKPAAEIPSGLALWLGTMLPVPAPGAAPDETEREKNRQKAAGVLVLLDALGLPVDKAAWLRVLPSPAALTEARRGALPSPVFEALLRDAGGRRGEAVLLSLTLAGAPEVPVGATAQAVRALRNAGLEAEARRLAREAVMVLVGSTAPPSTGE